MDNSLLWPKVYKTIGAQYGLDHLVNPCIDAVLACQQGEFDKEIYMHPQDKISLHAWQIVDDFGLKRFVGPGMATLIKKRRQ